jgi:hypothetical protein
MVDCKKCFKRLAECPGCKGRPNAGGRTCSKCDNTGLVCPDHGGYWSR